MDILDDNLLQSALFFMSDTLPPLPFLDYVSKMSARITGLQLLAFSSTVPHGTITKGGLQPGHDQQVFLERQDRVL